MIRGTANDVRIVGDENEWELVIETNVETFAFRIHHLAWDLAAHADETLGAWRREGENARATYVPRVTEEDLQAYDLNDPKRITLEQQ